MRENKKYIKIREKKNVKLKRSCVYVAGRNGTIASSRANLASACADRLPRPSPPPEMR